MHNRKLDALSFVILLLFAGVAANCDDRRTETDESASSSAPAPDDQSRSGKTADGRYRLEVTPDPNPIPFQEHFRLRVEIYEADAPDSLAEDVDLDDVRAVMPAHDHGMKTAPEIVRRKPGVFVVEGMRFHMRGPGEDGHWLLELVLNGPSGIDRASFDFHCCTPQ